MSKLLALIHIESADPRFHKRSFVMNPQGKSSITVLHEYSQRALKGRTIYHIEETRSATKPFHATGIVIVKKSVRVQIAGKIKDKLALLGSSNGVNGDADEDSIIVGRGEGPSKRIAKMVAAKQALAVLIPEIRFNDDFMATIQPPDATEKNYDDQAIALFDELPIEDPRISDLSVRTCQPKPLILLKLNFLKLARHLCNMVPSMAVKKVNFLPSWSLPLATLNFCNWSDSCSQKALEEDQELEDEDDESEDLDVHDILEEAVDKIKKEAEDSEPIPVVWKYVPERLEHDHFMNLPEGWTRITHNSGMPVYLHRKSRVISLSKPYFIGTQGVRDHRVPVTGIPCLHQRRILERDAALAAEAENQKKNQSESTLETEIKQKLIAPAVKIERQEDYLLTGEEYRKYAEKLFKFKTIQVKKFHTFKEKKAAYREKQLDQALKDSGVPMKMKEVLKKREQTPAGDEIFGGRTPNLRAVFQVGENVGLIQFDKNIRFATANIAENEIKCSIGFASGFLNMTRKFQFGVDNHTKVLNSLALSKRYIADSIISCVSFTNVEYKALIGIYS
ncbi:unnamed protein product [Heligmosomoides polygyrus]|uniref:DRBM domain-containing protein n=1 Tax=Heligmosomoides polygyrus TaxID=6339 RepID=A0A3P7U2P4_HELPZ|nr:unnamed protein product [Heligmosomoides polygyrus]